MAYQTIVFWIVIAFGAAAAMDDVSLPANANEERFSFERGGLVCVAVDVLGSRHSFILDTGSTTSVIDSSYSNRLGTVLESVEANTASGVSRVNLFRSPLMKIGIQFPEMNHLGGVIAAIDLKALREATGRDEMGIVGMDYLKDKTLSINFDEEFASIRTSSLTDDVGGERLFMKEGQPCVLIELPGEVFPPRMG